jgi:hypothetical protein
MAINVSSAVTISSSLRPLAACTSSRSKLWPMTQFVSRFSASRFGRF